MISFADKCWRPVDVCVRICTDNSLPQVPNDALCHFTGHVASLQAATSRRQQRACFATGCSVWFEFPNAALPDGDQRRGADAGCAAGRVAAPSSRS